MEENLCIIRLLVDLLYRRRRPSISFIFSNLLCVRSTVSVSRVPFGPHYVETDRHIDHNSIWVVYRRRRESLMGNTYLPSPTDPTIDREDRLNGDNVLI